MPFKLETIAIIQTRKFAISRHAPTATETPAYDMCDCRQWRIEK